MMDGRRIAVAAVAAILTFAPPVVAQRTTRHVFVSTLDENGTVVPNLRPADFSITEGGAPREVTRATTDVPMRVLLMVESTSAVGASLTQFRSALAGFLEALDRKSKSGFITTGGQLKIRVPPGTDSQGRRAADSGIFFRVRRKFDECPRRCSRPTNVSSRTHPSAGPCSCWSRPTWDWAAPIDRSTATTVSSATTSHGAAALMRSSSKGRVPASSLDHRRKHGPQHGRLARNHRHQQRPSRQAAQPDAGSLKTQSP